MFFEFTFLTLISFTEAKMCNKDTHATLYSDMLLTYFYMLIFWPNFVIKEAHEEKKEDLCTEVEIYSYSHCACVCLIVFSKHVFLVSLCVFQG